MQMQEYVNLSIAGHLAVIRSKLSAQRNAPTHFKNILTFRAWGNTGGKKKKSHCYYVKRRAELVDLCKCAILSKQLHTQS